MGVILGGVIGLSSSCCAQQSGRKMPEGRLQKLEYVRQGSMAGAEYKGTVTTDSTGVAVLEAMREPYGPLYRVTLSDGQLDSLRTIIEEEEMYKYKSHYEPPVRVYDGYSWSFYAGFEGNEGISSGGSNARPKGGGLERICEMMRLLASQPEAEELPHDGPVW